MVLTELLREGLHVCTQVRAFPRPSLYVGSCKIYTAPTTGHWRLAFLLRGCESSLYGYAIPQNVKTYVCERAYGSRNSLAAA
jgi:hypothetical protein